MCCCRIRAGNWEADELSVRQLEYAANDALAAVNVGLAMAAEIAGHNIRLPDDDDDEEEEEVVAREDDLCAWRRGSQSERLPRPLLGYDSLVEKPWASVAINFVPPPCSE